MVSNINTMTGLPYNMFTRKIGPTQIRVLLVNHLKIPTLMINHLREEFAVDSGYH